MLKGIITNCFDETSFNDIFICYFASVWACENNTIQGKKSINWHCLTFLSHSVSPQVIEILGCCPAGPVLSDWEKVPL